MCITVTTDVISVTGPEQHLEVDNVERFAVWDEGGIYSVGIVPGPIKSIERAAAILEVLARAPYGVGVVEVAAALGLAKGTAHGILRTLQRVGYVEQDHDTAKYRLGTEVLRLGGSHLDINELRSHAINWADTLAARTGEAVRIGTLQDTAVLVVHHVFRPDDSPQTLEVGTTLPLHATALGKILLTYTPGLVEQLIGRELISFTRRTVASQRALTAEIVRTRSLGWAAEVAEFGPTTAAVAAPIRDHGGRVVGAIGVSGSVERICRGDEPHPTLVAHLRSAALAVSQELGKAGW